MLSFSKYFISLYENDHLVFFLYLINVVNYVTKSSAYVLFLHLDEF